METGKGSAEVSYWQWTSFKDAKGKTKVDKLKLSVPGFVFSKKRVNKNDIKWLCSKNSSGCQVVCATARSRGNKTMENDIIVGKNADLMFISETWINMDTVKKKWL